VVSRSEKTINSGRCIEAITRAATTPRDDKRVARRRNTKPKGRDNSI